MADQKNPEDLSDASLDDAQGGVGAKIVSRNEDGLIRTRKAIDSTPGDTDSMPFYSNAGGSPNV